MQRLKKVALSLWQEGENAAKGGRRDAESRRAETEALLQARCDFMEERLAAQAEYIRELNSALSVAKSALVSAMHCLGSEDELSLPDLAQYIPLDQAREGNHREGEQRDASGAKAAEADENSCDAESFSNIENALFAADVLLEGAELAEGKSAR